MEFIEEVQKRSDDGLEQDCISISRRKWADSKCSLKVKPTGLTDKLTMGFKKRRR